jgi:hypothetical protein
MDSDDPIDSVSGSMGLTGCVDTVSVLARSTQGTTLYIRGRDVEEQEKAIVFNKTTCRWTVQGDAEEVRMSETRAKIVTTLEDRHKVDEPLTPSQIASLVTISEPAVRQRLGNLVENGQIIRVSRGRYVSAKRDDLLSAKPHHNRHNVTKSPKVTK